MIRWQWPFENDTSAITKKLAKNSLKAGKMRNILIVLTILLSVALMSGLALYIASMQTANSRQFLFRLDFTNHL